MTRFDHYSTSKAGDDPGFAPESTPWNFDMMPDDAYSRSKTNKSLGPCPEQTVAAFHDLGLSDDEIARYFGAEPHNIRNLSYGGQRSGRAGTLREFAQQMRTKLFGGTSG